VRVSKTGIFGWALSLLAVICGCGGGSSSGGGGTTNIGAPLVPATTLLTITPSSAFLQLGQAIQFSATANGQGLSSPIWSVNNVAGGTTATGTITSAGLYTAPTGSTWAQVQVSVKDAARAAQSAPVTVFLFDPKNFPRGKVSSTNNPLVAQYAIRVPQGASVQVRFGTTTAYGLNTWTQQAPTAGGDVSILVAGMRAGTNYHMQAVVHLSNGDAVFDSDQTFITGALPAGALSNLTVQQTAGLTPAAGVEMLCLFEGTSQSSLTAVVTDLAGNIIWYYPIQPNSPFPMKLLPNGHILVAVSSGLNGSAIQEIDLAGNIISQVSLSDVQQGLADAGISYPSLLGFHHDVLKLPNGHLIMLVNYTQTFTNQPGITSLIGDALIDWDPAQGPVWTWSTFDHIPLTRGAYGSDWTHANAVVYSPDDGNLILSMRNQNWVVKIKYEEGTGDGSILWRLGNGGDFTLPAGQAPMEWNYGQHYPVLLGPNSAGIFPLLLFNNGNERAVDANNDPCGTAGQAPCYSSVPVYQLNEYTHTAEVLRENNLSPMYSSCCGNAAFLANGDLEYNVAATILNVPVTQSVSVIQEVTPDQNPQLVWQMSISGQLAYRGFRIPSLYPGVQWTQDAIATANATSSVQLARIVTEARSQAHPTTIH